MRLLYFTRDYTPHDHRFLTSLAESGIEVFYLRLEKAKSQVEDRSLPSSIKQIQWRGGKETFKWGSAFGLALSLRQVIQHVKPDILHAGPIPTVAFLAATSGFVPLVSMSWGSDLLQQIDRSKWLLWTTRFALRRTSVLIGDCKAVHDKAVSLSFPAERIVTFPWGVDVQRFHPGIPSSLRERLGWQKDFVILSLRSWEPVYGVDVLVRAFCLAALQEPCLRLILMGGGSQSSLIRQMVHRHKLDGRVFFGGQVSNDRLPEFHNAADLYVSASHSDGSSVSLLETLACGKPVLVSDIPSNREWVQPEVNGWLFPDGNVEALVERMLAAVRDRSKLPEMGRASRSIAEAKADWRKGFGQLLAAYDLALEVEKRQPLLAKPLKNKPRVVAIIQARMTSTRLPGKVLRNIGGRPMLAWVVERTKRATLLDAVVVATTVEETDDPIFDYCQQQGILVYRGNLNDVLDRYYQAARQHHADVIVRITADCPLIDPVEIDHVVEEFFKQAVDFAANRLPPPFKRTYPIGLDTEVCSFAALERAWKEATEKYEREHVMPYLYSIEGRFKTIKLDHETDYGHYRWTVDNPADLKLVNEIVHRFDGRDDFSWRDVIALFEREPELALLNAGLKQKPFNQHG